MANVPLDTRFIGISPNVNLTERRSAIINAETAPYTMADIVETAGVGYLKYVAVLAQTGTDAPQIIVLENTTGLTFTSIYNAVGNYTLKTNVPNSILINKVGVIIGQNGTLDLFIGGVSENVDNDEIYLGSWRYDGGTFSPQDDRLYSTFIEIRIYP